jgi:hypothetical protein
MALIIGLDNDSLVLIAQEPKSPGANVPRSPGAQ